MIAVIVSIALLAVLIVTVCSDDIDTPQLDALIDMCAPGVN